MSRSKRKTPICSLTCAGFDNGEKRDKQRTQRAYRHRVRILLACDPESHLPLYKDYSDPYLWEKDGKVFFDPALSPQSMRK